MSTYTVSGVTYDFPDNPSDQEALDRIQQIQGRSVSTNLNTASLLNGGTSAIDTATNIPTQNSDRTTDPDQLQFNHNWLDASRKLYEYNHGAKFDGTDSDLAEYGLDQMGWFNYNMPTMAVDAVRVRNAPDDVKQSFVHLMDTYDNLDMSWSGAGRFIKGVALDPTTYVGLGTLGIGTVVSGGAKIASKQALKELLISGVRTGIEGSIQAGVSDAIQQSVRIDAGTQQSFDAGQLATSTGSGFAVGGALGAAAPLAGRAIGAGKDLASRLLGRDVDEAATKAGEALTPNVPTDATPDAVSPDAVAAKVDNATPQEGVPSAVEAPTTAATNPDVEATAKVEDGPTVATAAVSDAKAPVLEPQPEGGEAVAVEKPLGKPTDPQQLELFPNDTRVQTEAKTPEGIKVEPVNVEKRLTDNPVYEAIRKIANDDGGRTFPTSAASIAKAVEDPVKVLQDIKPADIKANIEELRRAYSTGQERQLIDQSIQAATEQLLQKNAEITKQLADPTIAPEVREALTTARDASYQVEQALRLADLDQSSMTGANLGSRAGNLNTGNFRNVSAESILKDRGIDPFYASEKEWSDAKNDYYSKLLDLRDEQAKARKVTDLQTQAQAALDQGDYEKAVQRVAEAESVAGKTTDNGISPLRLLTEYMISNVFSLKSVVVNSVPHVMGVVFRPAYEAAIKGLDGKAISQAIAQYSIMGNNIGTAWRAALASFKYEKGLLSGDMRFLEQDAVLKRAYGGGLLRIFPRLNGAVDDFFGQLTYRSFVASEAAGRAYDEAIAKGLTGSARRDFVQNAYRSAVEQSFSAAPRTSVVSFLREAGISNGYTGDKLDNWVVEQLNKNGTLFREATNQMGLNFSNDIAFKRNFRGSTDNFGNPTGNTKMAGIAGDLASSYEQFVNRNPWMRLVGQMFFRTPVRVFEAGFRLTAGLNLVTPGFLRDLTGKGFGGVGGYAQVRAQGELFLSYAIAQAAVYLYSQGKLHGSGSFAANDYQLANQRAQDPNFSPYSVRIGDSEWSFRNVDPFATPMKIIANALDSYAMLETRRAQGENVSKAQDDALAYLSVASLSIAQSVKDANLMQGLNELSDLESKISDPDAQSGQIMKYLAKKTQSLIPNQISKFQALNDPTMRDPTTLSQYLEAKILPQWAPKRYDAMGFPVKQAAPATGIYGFPDITTDAQRNATYATEYQKAALHGLALTGTLTNTNYTANYDGAKFAGSSNPYLQSLAGQDLRAMQTHDGTETWYDRAQRYVSQSGVDKQLADLFAQKLPIGTPSNKGVMVTQAKALLDQARERALLRVQSEEDAITIDKYRNNATKRVFDLTGKHDVPSPL